MGSPEEEIRTALWEMSVERGERQRAAYDRALAALERLVEQRDVALHAASLVENPEYVATLQRAGVEYVEELVAEVERLRAHLGTKP